LTKDKIWTEEVIQIKQLSDEEPCVLAMGELECALAFADFATSAYSGGRIHHAIDLRSKASFLHERGTAHLSRCLACQGAEALKSLQEDVYDLLSRLQDPTEWQLRQ